MKALRTGLVGGLLLVSCDPSAAQAVNPRVADMSIMASVEPNGSIRPGSTATVALVFTNRGPDALPDPVAIASPLPLPPLNSFVLVSDGQLPSCTVSYDFIEPAPGRPPQTIPIVAAGPLGPGESRTCHIQIATEPHGTGEHTLVFGLFDADVPWNDPFPADNAATISFSIGFPEPVRVPTFGWAALLTMILGVVAAAFPRHRHTG